MNKQKKLIVALTSVISVLEKQGCAGIFRTIELKDGTKEKIECIDEIKKYIDNNLSCKPYEFEDLKEGMWVFDDIDKDLIKCKPGYNKLNQPCVYIDCDDNFNEIQIYFEEGRFYPPNKINEDLKDE